VWHLHTAKEMIDDFYAQVPESHDADLQINVGHSLIGINKVACYNLEKGAVLVAEFADPLRARERVNRPGDQPRRG